MPPFPALPEDLRDGAIHVANGNMPSPRMDVIWISGYRSLKDRNRNQEAWCCFGSVPEEPLNDAIKRSGAVRSVPGNAHEYLNNAAGSFVSRAFVLSVVGAATLFWGALTGFVLSLMVPWLLIVSGDVYGPLFSVGVGLLGMSPAVCIFFYMRWYILKCDAEMLRVLRRIQDVGGEFIWFVSFRNLEGEARCAWCCPLFGFLQARCLVVRLPSTPARTTRVSAHSQHTI
uniref:Uncharacterized protein n=1 Tax=Zooxanthella nutricula TaxID=1333877 RepID=A0A6U6L0C4_9DINO